MRDIKIDPELVDALRRWAELGPFTPETIAYFIDGRDRVRDRILQRDAWNEGYMRGLYPYVIEGQADPIPPGNSPPTWGPNANPYEGE